MYQTETYIKELDRAIDNLNLDLSLLENKSFVIAGATGMIGSAFADLLLRISDRFGFSIKLYLFSRKLESLRSRFDYCLGDRRIELLQQDVCDPISKADRVDYIIHSASDANPVAYATRPVEVMKSNFIGMQNLLDFGYQTKCKRFLYVSSGEVYGQLDDLHDGFAEDYSGYVDYSDARSCYPSSKRAAEVLCQSYIKEYGVDVVIVRPCHIYGPTMIESDTRAATAFIRSASKNQSIVLKSDGMARRTMCYVFDTAAAMLYVLLLGTNGNAYNISNENCNVSIREIAETAAGFANQKVIFDIPNATEKQGFNRVKNAVLHSDKLRSLGWNPDTDIKMGIKNTMDIIYERKISDDKRL